ncbi:MAG: hypothetical protein H6739_29420 [Alphaproteobacteria bacterium]|nr:hypothetical protein [Alphaproteobacteria bacterium]
MAASTLKKHLFDSTITLSDGDTPANTLEIPFTVGDLTIDNLSDDGRAHNIYDSKGRLSERVVRPGELENPSGSFSCQIADFSDATNETALDFLMKTGSFASNVGTLGTGQSYTLNILISVAGVSLGDPAEHTALIPHARIKTAFAEGEPNTLSFSYEGLGGMPTFT